jgi:hypothetical protein
MVVVPTLRTPAATTTDGELSAGSADPGGYLPVLELAVRRIRRMAVR